MKLAELIESVNKEKPNGFSTEHLTLFVNECEAITQEFLRVKRVDRVKYKFETDGSKELVVIEPYDVLYKDFLKAKIDYSNEEYESYANNQAQFENSFADWRAYVIRTSTTETKSFKNWF